jgi:hypothetical protein
MKKLTDLFYSRLPELKAQIVALFHSGVQIFKSNVAGESRMF